MLFFFSNHQSIKKCTHWAVLGKTVLADRAQLLKLNKNEIAGLSKICGWIEGVEIFNIMTLLNVEILLRTTELPSMFCLEVGLCVTSGQYESIQECQNHPP